ncbi:MAG: PqqD family protein [Acidimicrobiia bacterium]|nr:PqqD family protein [Acidimicrobiia bacterium]
MMMFREATPSSTPAPSASVSLARFDDEPVLVDEERCRIETINEVGAVVWQCLDGESTLEEIAVDLADVYGADPATVLDDVVGLVTQLSAMQLVDRDAIEPLAPGVAVLDQEGAVIPTAGTDPFADPKYLGVPPSS